ncbi:ankyrin repeat domain-containing protein [Lysinibacillus xylanilyticus]|uniref:ankyrin repeat domain-containing protein n=1 Tax=Lysinibacillus xylanilyticus TaxID=582475 RepID=UPI00382B0618
MKNFNDLYDLVELDEFEEVKDILNENAILALSKDEYGFTLLHAAVSTENTELVKYIIDLGVDVNSKNDDGISPLHIVLYPEVAECLLDHGALIDITANNGDTPLHTQVSDGEERIDNIQLLLNRGANREIKNTFGKIALDIAKSREETLIIKELLKK